MRRRQQQRRWRLARRIPRDAAVILAIVALIWALATWLRMMS